MSEAKGRKAAVISGFTSAEIEETASYLMSHYDRVRVALESLLRGRGVRNPKTELNEPPYRVAVEKLDALGVADQVIEVLGLKNGAVVITAHGRNKIAEVVKREFEALKEWRGV